MQQSIWIKNHLLNSFNLLVFIQLTWCSYGVSQDLIDGKLVKSENLIKNGLAAEILNADLEKSSVIDLFNLDNRKSSQYSSEDIEGFLVLSLSTKSIERLMGFSNKRSGVIRIGIPSQNGKIVLAVKEFTPFSESFTHETGGGENIPIDLSSYKFYHGIVEGDTESFVSMSIKPSGLQMIISDINGNYNISRLKDTEDTYIFFNDYKLKSSQQFFCGMDNQFTPTKKKDLEPKQIEFSINKRGYLQKAVRNRVEVQVVVDYDLYVLHGMSTVNVFDWVIDIISAAISWHQMEFISLNLSEVITYTTNNDPFNNIGDDMDELGEQLEDWAEVWNPKGDLAHYLGSESGAMLIGKANGIGGICDPIDGPLDPETAHCASLGLPATFNLLNSAQSMASGFDVPSWTMYVFCHEMGHVFGSPHTHNCNWGEFGFSAIDDCAETEGVCDPGPTPINGGTMMSYCTVNLSKGYHSEPGALIRSTINSSSCFGHYENGCPVVTTIVNSIDNSGTYDATELVFIYDSEVLTGNTPLISTAGQTIIYGNFTVPTGAGIRINDEGCSF